MRFRVVKLRQGGKRKSRRTILGTEPIEGRVGIVLVPDEKGFPVRIAVLRCTQSSVNNCLAQLLEPQIMAITSQAILLKGIESDSSGFETIQEWWCRH